MTEHNVKGPLGKERAEKGVLLRALCSVNLNMGVPPCFECQHIFKYSRSHSIGTPRELQKCPHYADILINRNNLQSIILEVFPEQHVN